MEAETLTDPMATGAWITTRPIECVVKKRAKFALTSKSVGPSLSAQDGIVIGLEVTVCVA